MWSLKTCVLILSSLCDSCWFTWLDFELAVSENAVSRPGHRDTKQEGAAVEGLPAMGPSLQLSTCMLFWAFLGLCKAARDPYATCQISSWSDNRRRSYGNLSPTTQLAAVTLTSDPLTLKMVHGVLVSQGPFLPSLVFVGLFVFPLGGGTGQTDRQTGSTHDGASF